MDSGAGNIKELLRGKIPIEDYISQSVKLTKRGGTLIGLCPFHKERTPSFQVTPDRGVFNCFGCGARGDIFTFVQITEMLDFKGALRFLADHEGIALTNHVQTTQNQPLYDILETVCEYFQNKLPGSPSQDYLRSRGINPETTGEFRLGHAPSSFDYMFRDLKIDPALLLTLGLINESNSDYSSHYSTFRNRLMIPIFQRGRVTGFAARSLDDATPKYINSPKSPTYNKRTILFGLDQAMQATREAKKLIIFEGYLDAISAHQAGIKNSVALGGTALTENHVELLSTRLLTLELILCFDGDSPGRDALVKAMNLLLKRGNTRVCELPDGTDPDSIIQSGGNLEYLLNGSISGFDFLVRSLSQSLNLSTIEGKLSLVQRLRAPISQTTPQQRAAYIEHLAAMINTTPEAVNLAIFDRNQSNLLGNHSVSDNLLLLEARLMQQLISSYDPRIVGYIARYISPDHLSNATTKAIYRFLLAEKTPLLDNVFIPLFNNTKELVDAIAAYSQPDEILDKAALHRMLSIEDGMQVSLSEIEETAFRIRGLRLYDETARKIKSGKVSLADIGPLFE